MALETVTVDRGGQPVRINKSDFDPAKDTLWDDKLKDDAIRDKRAVDDKARRTKRSARYKKDAD